MQNSSNKTSVTIVFDNLRSCHNVGAILRTANGFNCQHFIFIGTTPYPQIAHDQRLPHQIRRQSRQISKTALGAEETIEGQYFPDTRSFIKAKKEKPLICLEQTKRAERLSQYQLQESIYLVVGNEIEGVSSELLERAQTHLFIPMLNHKESFNVATALGIALYQLLMAH